MLGTCTRLWSATASVIPTVVATPTDNPTATLTEAANEKPLIAGSSLPVHGRPEHPRPPDQQTYR